MLYVTRPEDLTPPVLDLITSRRIVMNMLKPIALALALAACGTASATINTVYSDFDGGLTSFNNTVTGAGSTATHDVWSTQLSGTSVDRGAYTVYKNNNGSMSSSIYTLWASSPSRQTSGYMVSINPSGTGAGHGTGDGSLSKGSGLTLDFGAKGNSVNAIGFEVGDWSTCCQVSDLYISFDNNAPIRVGHSTVYGDGFLTNGGAGVFVAAFDDTATFAKVSFWGDGWGEVLNMGGTIHYASLKQGSLPPNGVPEPMSMALVGVGLLGLGLTRRRKSA